MSNTYVSGYEAVCRFCGQQKNYGKYLFGNKTESCDLIIKIEQQFSPEVIFIKENDDLTKFVCFQCEMTINYFSEFCYMVKEVQRTLKEKSLQIACERQNYCHTVDVLKNFGTVTLCIGSEGAVTCQCCQMRLNAACLASLNIGTCSDGRILCCCLVCGYKDQIKSFLINNKHDNIQCPQCIYMYGQKLDTKTSQNEERRHICDLCSKSFRSKGHLNRHKLTHFNVKPFTCEICNMKFSQKSVLKTHSLIHEQSSPLTCKWCCQTFRYKTSLHEHTINYHGTEMENKKSYECDRCKKHFISKVKLERHYRSHSGEQPFKCYVCNKRFSQLINLKTHSKKHVQNNNGSNNSTNNDGHFSAVGNNAASSSNGQNIVADVAAANIYHAESLLQHSDENEKYLEEIFPNCEPPLTLDSIQIEDNNFDPKLSTSFNVASAANEIQSAPASPCNMFFNVSSTYTMYSSNNTDLIIGEAVENAEKSSLLASFCSINSDNESICL